MPSGQQWGAGALGFIAGLTQALDRKNQRNREDQKDFFQLAEKSGRYDIVPVEPGELRPAGFFQTLLTGNPYRQPAGGPPVLPMGQSGGGMALKERDTVNLDYLLSQSRDFLDADEEKGVRLALAPYIGQPRSPEVVAKLGQILSTHFNNAARIRQERAEKLISAKVDLSKLAQGTTDPTLVQDILRAPSLDALLALYSRLPSAAQLEADKIRAKIPSEVEREKALGAVRQETRAPSRVDLARQAAAGDPVALKALSLLATTRQRLGQRGGTALADAERRWNLPGIAMEAARGNPEALRALEELKKLKATSARRGERRYPEAGPLDHPSTSPGAVTGQGSFPPPPAPSTPPPAPGASSGPPRVLGFEKIK
jgi:hypothetical protein